MSRHFLIFLTLIAMWAFPANSKLKFNISDEYMVTTSGTGVGGTKFVVVKAYGKDVKEAMAKAKVDAVAAAIFRGLPAGGGAQATPALSPDGERLYTKYTDYFNRFFDEKSGEYIQFVNFTNSDIPSGANNIQTSKGRQVTVFVQIMHDNLRKRLETDGIIESTAEKTAKIGRKPIIMVIPEAAWLKQQGCVDASGNVDFRRALDYSNDLRNTIGIIGSLMSEKGMDLTLLESKLDELDAEAARMAVATGKDGAGLQTSELDELSKVANADFLIEVGIFPHAYGPRKQYEIRISGKDTSSLTQFDSQTINSSPSSAPVSELIKEVLLQYIDPFVDKLHAKFDDISRNGREGYLTLKLTGGSPLDFESEVTIGGESGELADAIDMWLDENTVNGQYTKSTGNTTTLKYEHVRLPLSGKGAFGKKEKAIDAEQFGKNLGKFLSQFGLSTRVEKIALGKAYLYIGAQ